MRIPTLVARNTVPSEGPGAVIPLGAGTQPYQALGDVGTSFHQAAAAEYQIDAARRYGRAMQLAGQAASSLNDLRDKYEQDTDYDTLSQRFGQDVQAIRQQAMDQAGDPATAQAFAQRFDHMVLAENNKIRDRARRGKIDLGRAGVEEGIDGFVTQAAQAGTPEERQAILGQIDKTYLVAAHGGLFTYEQAGEQIRKSRGRVDSARALHAINTDPEKAVQDLSDSKNFPALDEVSRERLYGTAQAKADAAVRERVRLAEKAERDAEKKKREWQEGNELQLLVAASQGNVSSTQLNDLARRRAIRPDAYRALTSMIEKGGTTDGAVYFTLRDKINRGEDATAEIYKAMAAHAVSAQDAAQLSDHNRSVQRGEDVYSTQDYRNAEGTLKASIGEVGPLGNLYKQEDAQRFQAAVRELRDRVKASGITMQNSGEIWKIVDEMEPRYRASPPSRGSLPQPQFGKVTTLDDIAKIATATAEAYRAKQIDPAAMITQDALLKRWEDVLTREQADAERRRQAQEKSGKGTQSRIDKAAKKTAAP